MLTEEAVYLGTKNWLKSHGYTVLAGQPARGTDHLPVIEIKSPTGKKGSKFSYKPDLFAFKDGYFYVIECKPSFNYGDCEKIWDVLQDDIRSNALYEEADQYRLLSKVDYRGNPIDFHNHLRGIVAYSPPYHGMPNILHLVVESFTGMATMHGDLY